MIPPLTPIPLTPVSRGSPEPMAEQSEGEAEVTLQPVKTPTPERYENERKRVFKKRKTPQPIASFSEDDKKVIHSNQMHL